MGVAKKLLLDGFFFDDHNLNPAAGDGNPEDLPEATLSATLSVALVLGLDLVVLEFTAVLAPIPFN